MRFSLVARCGLSLFLCSTAVLGIQLGEGYQKESLESVRARAIESYALLRELDQGKSFSFGNVSKAVSAVSSYLADMARSNGLPSSVKPFVILSQQRSGSGFICSMLDSHPDLMCALGEPYGPGTYFGPEHFHGSLNEAFDMAMKKVLEKLKAETVPSNVKWFGIKVQSNQVPGIEGGVANTDAMVIFHFRRSALRQIISGMSSMQTQGTLNSHAKTEAELVAKAAFKPTIGEGIKLIIAARLKERHDIVESVTKAGANVCTTSHYEDWLNPVTLPAIEQKIFDCFGVQTVELSAGTVAVHAHVPVLESVANPEVVVKALKGSPFEYMLENNGATSEEVFENLKKTDDYEREPPSI